jgi:class 3 adenylate cyclase
MKNIRLLPFLIVTLVIIPLGLFLYISYSTLKTSIKSSVVNDPDSSLAQSIAGFGGAYNSLSDKLLITAVRFSEKESFRKALSAPVSQAAALKKLCEEAAPSAASSLFILADSRGNVLFDTLHIPKPTPTPLPLSASKAKKPKIAKNKPKKPLYASIRDWPGMDRALSGSDTGGIFSYQGSLYRVMVHPILGHEKTQGVIWIGRQIDKSLLDLLKAGAGSDLAVYSGSQTFCTQALAPPPLDYIKATGFNHPTVHWGGQDYLVGGVSLAGLDQKLMVVAVLFQPIERSMTMGGHPEKTILESGLLILLATLFFSLVMLSAFMAPYHRLAAALDQMKKGEWNVNLPTGSWNEWGPLGASLKEMIGNQKEKERISLILGKVVDPQAAKKILADKDYFALKGERRECTLLQADLRGFNILSENMTPEALVEALNQYFGIINEVVFKYEGMLDKFIGDTALAIWGAPFTHDDKELRAVKTALEIQEALKDFNISRIKKGNPPFTIAIGIHTGTVVAGNLGSDKRYDYTVIGDPIHVVNRLCSMAAPGQTVVSDETYQKIRQLVQANPLHPIAVRGSMESLPTYEITQLI